MFSRIFDGSSLLNSYILRLMILSLSTNFFLMNSPQSFSSSLHILFYPTELSSAKTIKALEPTKLKRLMRTTMSTMRTEKGWCWHIGSDPIHWWVQIYFVQYQKPVNSVTITPCRTIQDERTTRHRATTIDRSMNSKCINRWKGKKNKLWTKMN